MHKCQQVWLQGSAGPGGPAGGKGFLGPEDSCGPTQTPCEEVPCRAGPLCLLQRADQLRDRQDATLTDGSPCGQDTKCSTQQVSPLEVYVSARSIQRMSVSKPDTTCTTPAFPRSTALYLTSAGLTHLGRRVWDWQSRVAWAMGSHVSASPSPGDTSPQTQAVCSAWAHGNSKERTQARKKEV